MKKNISTEDLIDEESSTLFQRLQEYLSLCCITFKSKCKTPQVVPDVVELIDNYSKDSTIHGMKYVGEKNRHWSSKLFWIVIFATSIFFCTKNIIEINRVRKERPVMVSFAKNLAPSYEIPFSAVTICPEMKATCDKINLIELMNRANASYTSEESSSLAALTHVCDTHLLDEKIQSVIAAGTNRTAPENVSVVEKLTEISPAFELFFDKCRFSTWRYENCDEFFHKVVTDVGICYTFNMLNFRDYLDSDSMHPDLLLPAHEVPSSWFLDKDYNSPKVHVYPRRILGAGMQAGLSVQLRMNSSQNCASCAMGVQGFRVALHMPVELPELSKHFYNVPYGHETTLIAKPNMIYASKDIRDYEPHSRQCFFNGEKKLKFFKIYTMANCELECKADLMLEQCGCVKFSMPRSNETAVCGKEQLECAHEAESNYTIRDLQRRLLEKQLKRATKHGKTKEEDGHRKKLKKLGTCKCLPACTHIKYNVEISQTDYQSPDNGVLLARLNVYFEDSYISRQKRYEIYGWTDWVSQSGGTLGLFMGCSILSFIEILYHVIIYTVMKIRKKINPENISTS